MRELKSITKNSQKHVDIILSHMTLIDRMQNAYYSLSKQAVLDVTDAIRRESRNKTVGLHLGNKYDILLNVAKHLKCLDKVHHELFIYENGVKSDYTWMDKPFPEAPLAVPNPCTEIKTLAPPPGSIICTKPGSINTIAEAQRYANRISNLTHPPFVKPAKTKAYDDFWKKHTFKPTEETPMKFVSIEKQLLVNGENVLALNAEQLTTRISEFKKRQDELYDIPFSSKRIGKEIDKLDNIMSKLIKRLDRM